jgi:hypothetical protein
MKMENDSRTYPRLTIINWPATILTKENSIDASVRNLSRKGAYIYYQQPHETAMPLRLHSRVGLVIRVPDRLPLLTHARVAWSDIMSSDERNTLIGVGLLFTNIFYEDRQFLRDLVKKYSL